MVVHGSSVLSTLKVAWTRSICGIPTGSFAKARRRHSRSDVVWCALFGRILRSRGVVARGLAYGDRSVRAEFIGNIQYLSVPIDVQKSRVPREARLAPLSQQRSVSSHCFVVDAPPRFDFLSGVRADVVELIIMLIIEVLQHVDTRDNMKEWIMKPKMDALYS